MALDKQFSMERPCIEAFWQSLREGQHEGDQQQRDAEDFFGSSSSGGHWHSRQQSQRALHRNVWSSSVEEEDRWIKCLLSANSQRNNNIGVNSPSNGNIPKIIHFIWLGEKSMPMFSFLIGYNNDEHLSVDEQFEQSVRRTIKYSSNESVESWRDHHPPSNGWEIVIWTEKDIIDDDIISKADTDSKKETERNKKYVLKQSQMRNRDPYRQALQMKNYGAASDILRLEILTKFGGIYADIDYFCVGSLDDIISSGNFFCGASNTGCVELNNGLMGCQTGGHPVLTGMIDSIHDYFEEKSSKEATKQEAAAVSSSMLSSFLDDTTRDALKASQTNDFSGTFLTPMEVIEHTGPGLLTRLVCRWLANNSDVEDNNASQDVIVFPFEKFHCFPNHFRRELSHNDRVTAKQLLTSFLMSKDAKAVHLWGCSWQKDQ